jgi:hypothetical protein
VASEYVAAASAPFRRAEWASKATDAERLAAMEKFHEELTGYMNRFEAAFDELHVAVVRQAKTQRPSRLWRRVFVSQSSCSCAFLARQRGVFPAY